MELSLFLLLVYYSFILLQVNIGNACDLTKENMTQTKKLLKYSKVKIHLHRSILDYIDFNSRATYFYLCKIFLWNPQGFNTLAIAAYDELTFMQHLVLLDTLYYDSQRTLGTLDTYNQIQSWFRIYSSRSLPILESTITFPYLFLHSHENILYKAVNFFYNWENIEFKVTEEAATYDYKKQILRLPNSRQSNIRSFPMPFSITFEFDNHRPQTKRIFDMKLLETYDFYTDQGFYFMVRIHQLDIMLHFKFNLQTNGPECQEIQLTTKSMSSDYMEQIVVKLTYQKYFSSVAGFQKYRLDLDDGSIFKIYHSGRFNMTCLDRSNYLEFFKKFFGEQGELFRNSKMYIQFF